MESWETQIIAALSRTDQLRQRLAVTSGVEEIRSLADRALEEALTALEELRVTDQELAEQNDILRKSHLTLQVDHARYADLFDQAPDGYFATDANGVIHEANRAASLLLNINPRFLPGKPLINFVSMEDRPTLRQQLLKLSRSLPKESEVTADAEVNFVEYIRMVSRYGRSFEASLRFSGVYAPEGKLLAVRWLLRDISESIRTEEEHYRLLIDAIQDYSVILLDGRRKILSWNRGAERIFGYSALEAIGMSATMLLEEPPEQADKLLTIDELRATQQNSVAQRRWYRRKSGTLFYGEGVLTMITRGGRARWIKVLQDITERKQEEEIQAADREKLEQHVTERTIELQAEIQRRERASEALQKASEQRQLLLEQLVNAQEEERQRISRELHDEMGQLISAFSLGLKALESSLPETADEGRQRLQSLHGLIERVGQDIHRLAVELRPTALDDLDIEAVLQSYVEDWSTRAGIDAEFQASISHSGQKPALSKVISTTLYRITQEALTNILKHAKAHHVSVVLNYSASSLLLVIEDDGLGFDVEQYLGEDEISGANGKSRRKPLGILGMQERVRLAGGSVTIESDPHSGGTTLYVRIPIALSEEPTLTTFTGL